METDVFFFSRFSPGWSCKKLSVTGILFFFLMFACSAAVQAQGLFIDSTFNRGFDNIPQDVVEIAKDRFVFLTTIRSTNGLLAEDHPEIKGKVMLFLADERGNVVRQRIILNDTTFIRYTATNIFLNKDRTLSIVGSFGDSLKRPASFFYAQADTNFNLLSYKTYNVSNINADHRHHAFCQSGNTLYGAVTYFLNAAKPYPFIATTLVKLSANGDLLKKQNMEGRFFGGVGYSYPVVWNITPGISAARILMNGTFF